MAIKEKNKAKRHAVRTRDPHDLAAYKQLKNRLKVSVHEAKLSYLRLLVKQPKQNPHLSGQLWRSVNDIIGKPKPHDSGISANVFPDSVDDFFCNVAVNDAHQPAELFVASPSSIAGSFQFTDISAETVLHMIECLDI